MASITLLKLKCKNAHLFQKYQNGFVDKTCQIYAVYNFFNKLWAHYFAFKAQRSNVLYVEGYNKSHTFSYQMPTLHQNFYNHPIVYFQENL